MIDAAADSLHPLEDLVGEREGGSDDGFAARIQSLHADAGLLVLLLWPRLLLLPLLVVVVGGHEADAPKAVGDEPVEVLALFGGDEAQLEGAFLPGEEAQALALAKVGVSVAAQFVLYSPEAPLQR